MKMTHVTFDGKTLSISKDEYDDFYKKYIEKIIVGINLHVVEMREENFKFYLDIDIVGTKDLHVSQSLDKIIHCIGIEHTCVVARAIPRPTPKGIKHGIHLIWPTLTVSIKKAQTLRRKVIDSYDGNVDCFDTFSSGLRMLWSTKCEEGSTWYTPTGEYSHGVFTEFADTTPSANYLRLFSIKSDENCEGVVEDPIKSTNLLEFIHKEFYRHSNLKVTKISKCRNGIDLCVATNSHYCENKKREHKSNHIWFFVDVKRGKIHQRCFDEECLSFKGRNHFIPSGILKEII